MCPVGGWCVVVGLLVGHGASPRRFHQAMVVCSNSSSGTGAMQDPFEMIGWSVCALGGDCQTDAGHLAGAYRWRVPDLRVPVDTKPSGTDSGPAPPATLGQRPWAIDLVPAASARACLGSDLAAQTSGFGGVGSDSAAWTSGLRRRRWAWLCRLGPFSRLGPSGVDVRHGVIGLPASA